MEDCLVETLPGKGRGVVCKNSIAYGRLLLQTNPVIYVPKTIQQKADESIQCFECLAALTTAKLRCSACNVCYYCDRKCQRKAWTTHKVECSLLQFICRKPLTATILLVLRILIHAVDTSDWTFAQNDKLVHYNINNDEIIAQMSQWVIEAVRSSNLYSQNSTISSYLTLKQMKDLFSKVMCNAFTICDREMNGIGTGVYGEGANLFNHSCVPNCSATFDGISIRITTQRDIAKGEELCITYTDVALPSKERIQYLEQNYFFTCSCPLCDHNTALPLFFDTALNGFLCPYSCNKSKNTADELCNIQSELKSCDCADPMPALQEIQRKFKLALLYQPKAKGPFACLRCKKCVTEERLEEVKQAIATVVLLIENAITGRTAVNTASSCNVPQSTIIPNLLQSIETKVHPAHIQVHKCRERYLQHLLSQQNFEDAYKICGATLPSYFAVYGAASPLYALQLALYGKLSHLLGEQYDETAVNVLQKALKILHNTHGKDHELTKNVEFMYSDAAEALSNYKAFL